MMQLSEIKKENYTIVSISGRLDTTNYQDLDNLLQQVMERGEKSLIIDSSKMNYVSSSGLRVFLMYLKEIKAKNGRFVLSGMQDSIHEIFKISGFTSIFEIMANLEDAEKSVAG